MYKIALVVGSLRKGSINKKLARALEKTGSGIFEFKTIDISRVPLYNGDFEASLPDEVRRLKDEIAACDGVLFVTPEYNRAIPGVLKNVLDWGSRPYGANVWSGKAAAMAGASEGGVGTAVAQAQLRDLLGVLGMRLTVQPELYFQYKPELIADDGKVTDERTRKYLESFLNAFKAWMDQLGKA